MFRKRHNSRNEEDVVAFQEEKIEELKAAIGPLSGSNSKFCSDACLRRYLKARNWNVAKSKSMLEESLRWRNTYKPEEIRWHEVAHEGETGKLYRANFTDKNGRSVLVLKPGKQNTKSHDNQLRHLVYLIENAILNLPEDEEQMVWLIDFSGWSLSTSVPIKTARETANILQNHYPERLAAAFLYNPPRIFEALWKVIKLVLDPVTFQKVNFVYPKKAESIEVMHKSFDVDLLPKEFGGNNNTQYDHKEFSLLMNKDDIKTAELWGADDEATVNSAEAVPKPPLVSTQAS